MEPVPVTVSHQPQLLVVRVTFLLLSTYGSRSVIIILCTLACTDTYDIYHRACLYVTTTIDHSPLQTSFFWQTFPPLSCLPPSITHSLTFLRSLMSPFLLESLLSFSFPPLSLLLSLSSLSHVHLLLLSPYPLSLPPLSPLSLLSFPSTSLPSLSPLSLSLTLSPLSLSLLSPSSLPPLSLPSLPPPSLPPLSTEHWYCSDDDADYLLHMLCWVCWSVLW